MSFALAIIVCASFVVAVFHYSARLIGGEDSEVRRWFWHWAGKGVGVPLGIWMIWNVGLLPGLPAIMPQVARVQASGGNWAGAFFDVAASALFVIGSYWAAATFAWFMFIIGAREEIRSDFLGSALIWSVVLGPLACLILYVSGWPGAGFAIFLWLLPITHSSLPLLSRKKIGPLYSRAIGKMKMGKFEDAEWDILHELEKREDDFEGWLMLAELYATQFDDLQGADRTIHEICEQPNVTPSQISIALHRLADWQLKVREDPVAARRALEEIYQRLPGTHLATMARHRLNQLPASREELRTQRKGRTIHLPALNDSLDTSETRPKNESDRSQAEAKANQCVQKLKQNPDDVAVREELARLFAERLDRAELGIEQIELLLEMPGQSTAKAAEWLSLVGAWQLKYQHDPDSARQTLEKLLREYPQSAQAFAAQRRLKLMEVEGKMRALRQDNGRAQRGR